MSPPGSWRKGECMWLGITYWDQAVSGYSVAVESNVLIHLESASWLEWGNAQTTWDSVSLWKLKELCAELSYAKND